MPHFRPWTILLRVYFLHAVRGSLQGGLCLHAQQPDSQCVAKRGVLACETARFRTRNAPFQGAKRAVLQTDRAQGGSPKGFYALQFSISSDFEVLNSRAILPARWPQPACRPRSVGPAPRRFLKPCAGAGSHSFQSFFASFLFGFLPGFRAGSIGACSKKQAPAAAGAAAKGASNSLPMF